MQLELTPDELRCLIDPSDELEDLKEEVEHLRAQWKLQHDQHDEDLEKIRHLRMDVEQLADERDKLKRGEGLPIMKNFDFLIKTGVFISRVEAIKAYRVMTKKSLLDCKKIVDALLSEAEEDAKKAGMSLINYQSILRNRNVVPIHPLAPANTKQETPKKDGGSYVWSPSYTTTKFTPVPPPPPMVKPIEPSEEVKLHPVYDLKETIELEEDVPSTEKPSTRMRVEESPITSRSAAGLESLQKALANQNAPQLPAGDSQEKPI